MTLHVACESFIDPGDVTCDCGDLSEEELQELIDSASDILAIITGGKVSGRCEHVVRPCGGSCGCSRLLGCGCVPLSAITLLGPDITIDEVLIDGVEFLDYAIVDGNLLIRTDGGAWPGSQDITLSSTEPGTFEITYTSGMLPKLAQDAATEIVCSFIQSTPTDTRKPHPNTRGMSISGVQITLEQMASEIKRRAFMMPYVIRLLTVYAPDGPTPAVVYSPELEDGWKLHTITHPTGS